MSDSYEDILAKLKHEIEVEGARTTIIDICVNDILQKQDARTTGDLLLLLSDHAECHEGMFTLIHAAELLPGSPYITALLSIFPELMTSAPEWASIVLMRVLNGRPYQLELVRQLRNAPVPVKEAVGEACRRINEVSPEFLSKTIVVTVAATS